MQTNELTKYLVIEVDDNYNDSKNPLIFLRGNYNSSEEAMSARNSLENLAKYRGNIVGVNLAESFQIIRLNI